MHPPSPEHVRRRSQNDDVVTGEPEYEILTRLLTLVTHGVTHAARSHSALRPEAVTLRISLAPLP
jgi:hypothetical protein